MHYQARLLRRRHLWLSLGAALLTSFSGCGHAPAGSQLAAVGDATNLFVSLEHPVAGQAGVYDLLFAAPAAATGLGVCLVAASQACAPGGATYTAAAQVHTNGTTKFFKLPQASTLSEGSAFTIVAVDSAGQVTSNRAVMLVKNDGALAAGSPALGGTPVTGAGGTAAGPAASSAGCGVAATAGQKNEDVTVQGTKRTYIVSVPAGYNAASPHSLIFAFHGVNQSGKWMRGLVGSLENEAAGKAILVYPDGLNGKWDGGGSSPDLPFFDAMVAKIGKGLCIDTKRIFATGFSNGGFFTNGLAAARASVLRGIAPSSSGGGGGAVVPALILHGRSDDWVSFGSGEGSRDAWIKSNSCGSSTKPFLDFAGCVTYQGCGKPVVWCPFEGKHDWAPFASKAVWQFFSNL